MQSKRITVALTGNPNAGKTTIFNAITGARQHVGNWPGVTVERKEGTTRLGEREVVVVDLPGIYSLSAYSEEELVARRYLLDERPDVIVHVVDASNLERNLYLATQLLELGIPMVLAFNMSDVAKARGYSISARRLSGLLGVPIVRTVGNRRRGIDELIAASIRAADEGPEAVARQARCHFGREIEPHLERIQEVLLAAGLDSQTRWHAVKLLEDDEPTWQRLGQRLNGQIDELRREADVARRQVRELRGDRMEILLAERRYGFISGACVECVRQTAEARHESSDHIDAVLTHPLLGLPIFALVMFMLFQLTFMLGNPMVDALDSGKGYLAEAVRDALAGRELLAGLLADGIIEGVGAVLSFVPLIVLLYLGIAILEDSGYMARAAFVLDRHMHKLGLHGKSFIPLIIGFGCTVPAVMATRILETRRDRLTTIMALPLMSCSARLPVYVLLIGAFFGERELFEAGGLPVTNQALILLGLYALGVVLAVVAIKLLRSTLLRGEVTPLLMELPPYRMPTLRGLAIHTWERGREYVKKAGTVILGIVVILWALSIWPGLDQSRQEQLDEEMAAVIESERLSPDQRSERLAELEAQAQREQLENSAIGRIGRGLAVVLRPAGFDWKISTALAASTAAKEAFIGQMGVIYESNEDEGTLSDQLAADYTPLQGICMMLFVLISSPCIATVAMTAREAGWRWAALQWSYLMVLAWVVTTGVYQGGLLIGWGA
jgi:ferrous iron transport protein B